MVDRSPRLSHQTMRVLKIFFDSPRQRFAGAELARATRLSSGTLYPILDRFEKAGWLASEWESADPSTLGRPRRRLYEITAFGQRSVQSAFNELGFQSGGAAWAF